MRRPSWPTETPSPARVAGMLTARFAGEPALSCRMSHREIPDLAGRLSVPAAKKRSTTRGSIR